MTRNHFETAAWTGIVAFALILFGTSVQAAEKSGSSSKDGIPGPAITHHTLKIDGETLKYTATAGYIPLKNDKDETQAYMFYMAYQKEGADAEDRPVTFCFNGGPGASSAWLHLGALGPKRVLFPENGTVLPEDPRLTKNKHTWLTFTDLVFVDPIGTGYSHAAEGVDPKKYWSVQGDLDSVAEFIRLYITRNHRWLSPKYLAGESYGATRAGGLASHLQDAHDINLDGIALISSALDFQTIAFAPNHDLTYALYLPSMTATAFYHKRLKSSLQKDLQKTLAEVEKWAMSDYLAALAMGDALEKKRRKEVASKLARYTGLQKKDVLEQDLRIGRGYFGKNLLRKDNRKVGLYDGRVTGIASHPERQRYGGYDPSAFMTKGPLRETFNHYIRNELEWRTERKYHLLSGKVNHSWDWQTKMGYPEVLGSLHEAMTRNPRMKVLMACGYYDLTTTYLGSKWVVRHLDLAPEVRKNVTFGFYQGGHMMYTYLPALKNLTQDARKLYSKN